MVITGQGVPRPDKEENSTDVAREIIQKVTGIVLNDHEVKTCHRSGPAGANILVDFLFTGPDSTLKEVINPKHKQASFAHKAWLNLHQPQHDRKMYFIARKMVKAGEISMKMLLLLWSRTERRL